MLKENKLMIEGEEKVNHVISKLSAA